MIMVNTPEECFSNLPEYPFSAHFSEIGHGLKLHFVDEGPSNGEVVLLMHGEPSWSYLYRKMIPIFTQEGYRVLAPDLIGFGKSSKPTLQSDYSYARHLQWIGQWMNILNLKDINLFCQDWGGLIGLRLVAQSPDNFCSVVVSNTGLSTGDHQMPEAFLQWQAYSQNVDTLPVGKILQNSTVRHLTSEEIAAYEAPFPDASYQAGAKIFPSLVPTTPDDPESENNRKAWQVLMRWEKPFLTLFSDGDPITAGGEKVFQKLIPGAKNEPHQIVTGGGHFLQEDKGEEVAHIMINFMQNHR